MSISRRNSKFQKRLRALYWWFFGFVSALLTLLVILFWMAGAVYSELPPIANLAAVMPAVMGSEGRGQSVTPYDAIVCLTGGRGRIRKALELYEKGFGRMLYISGIDPSVQMKQILKEMNWVGPIDDRNIILENVATNTIENAEQVRRFISEQGLKSVVVVTSIYHARRAHYIFKKILPREVKLEMYWLERDPFDGQDWWKNFNGISVTVTEFFKFFYAYLRLASN